MKEDVKDSGKDSKSKSSSGKVSKMTNPAETLTPVLIIPGFMSSVLTVQSSTLQPSWKDKRLWLNISQLGFNKIQRGGKLQRNEEIRSTRILNTERSGKAAGQLDSSIEELHQQYLKQVESKNMWVEHIRLQDDMISDRKGVVVRALQGTAGVDYLSEGALTESMSYVFGPVLKLLRSVGYKDGVNLEAAPYDWRIPPSALETRDQYFTNTIETIEHLYHFNNRTPVVMLCHSMGCKTAHYLFNFVLHTKGKEDGLSWISTYINSYVPVGAPHIGAPASVRCIMDGDKMGLDAFLTDFEGLFLGRSFGSAPWLFPLEEVDPTVAAPQSSENDSYATTPQKATMPTNFIRQESTLHITIPSQRLNLESFFEDRDNVYPTKARLAIKLGKGPTVRSNYFVITQNEPFIDFNNETWIIPTPLDIVKTIKAYPDIQLCVEKPGAGLPKRRERGICAFDIFWPIRCALCIVKWLLCCPCALLGKVGRTVSSGAMRGVNLASSALGSSVIIGDSEPVNWGKDFLNSNKSADTEGGAGAVLSMNVELKPRESDNGLGIWQLMFWKHQQLEKITLTVKWEPQSIKPLAEPVPLYQKSISYTSCGTKQLAHMEGMGRVIRLVDNTYEPDPIGPLSISSWHPPPVKRVIAIYGINQQTELAAVYKRNPLKHIPNNSNPKSQSSELQPTFVLDSDAILGKEISKTHSISKGIIFETSKSPQSVITEDGTNITEFKSGDATVPYWSLQHCRSWQGRGLAECEVTVHEIDSAEHRAILNDERFHKILLEILGFS